MRRAIELAQEGIDANDGGPFGCVVVKDGERSVRIVALSGTAPETMH